MGKSYPQEIREYALMLLEEGLTPKQVSMVILKKFKIFVPPNTIAKWKERYLSQQVQEEDYGEDGYEDPTEFVSKKLW